MERLNVARVIFDLDGTLIDSLPDIHALANGLLDAEGLDRLSMEDSRAFVGNGAPTFIHRMCQARGIAQDREPGLLAEFVRRYEDAHHHTQIYPGVCEALNTLLADGHHLGLCTNKPLRPTHKVLEHLNLAHYFPVIIGGDSLAVRKPDPAPLIAVAEELSTGAIVFVGDSEVDAETAERANVPFLLYTRGYRKSAVETIPHHTTFDDFSVLPGLIRETTGAS